MVSISNLIKQYKTADTFVIDNIGFSTGEGNFCFPCPYDVGKSTKISILTTTLSKTSGEINIAGYDLDKEAEKSERNWYYFGIPLDLIGGIICRRF